MKTLYFFGKTCYNKKNTKLVPEVFMKTILKVFSFVIAAAAALLVLNTVIEVMYNNSKKYFEAD